MRMWLTDIMEVLFAGAMICLLIDLAKDYTDKWRVYVGGVVCTAFLGIALIDVLVNWSIGMSPIPVQPTVSPLASLYVVDKFSIFVIFTILAVGTAISFYSWKTLSQTDNVGPFFSLLLILLLSLVGIAAAGDLLTLFLFWEGMSVAAYGLVAWRKEVVVSLEAALKYLFLAGAGSLIALFGISIIYTLAGSIQLKDLPTIFQNDPRLGMFGLVFLFVGLGVEAAIFPLHTWLPDAYSAAPTPVSATLAGVVTETGVFALIKIINPTFVTSALSQVAQTPMVAFQYGLVIIAVLTMLIGNLGALGETNVKRLLSYSSIAHVGYMLAALATFSVFGVVAIVFHIWNHGLVKSSFFMLTGNKGSEYKDAELSEVKGLFGENKLLGGMFALSSLGMIGVPPFGTFWSELLIIQSLFATNQFTFYIVGAIVVLNIAISVGYFSKVITAVSQHSETGKTIPTSWRLAISPLLLILLSLLTGFLPWLLLSRLS